MGLLISKFLGCQGYPASVCSRCLCVGRVVEALQAVNGQGFITADHGNAEQMLDETTGQAQTAHTTFPVPLIYIPPQGCKARLLKGGSLSDLAPSLLKVMGLKQPLEMTGKSLVEFDNTVD